MLGNIHVLDLIIILGAVQGIGFAIYLWIKPLQTKRASFFLALFIFSFACNCLYFVSESIGWRKGPGLWSYAPLYCSLLILASFYAFIHFLINPHKRFTWTLFILFLPALFQQFYQFTCSILYLTNKEVLFNNQGLLYTMSDVIDLFVVILGVGFLVVIIMKLRVYENKLQTEYAEIEDFSLKWLYQLIVGIILVFVLFMVPVIYEITTDNRLVNIYYPLWISTSALIYWIAYSTLLRNQKPVQLLDNDANKTSNVKLSDKTKSYHEALLQLMVEHKPYLDQDINLHSLAQQLDLSSGYLSQIINQYEGKNFFDFVNSYRVLEVKHKIGHPDYDHLNLLGIAYDSGFKSKSTFNLAFKKLTGMTPSSFKKQKKGPNALKK